ncbi:hypothetical protein D3C72_858960 [compost metagenome]
MPRFLQAQHRNQTQHRRPGHIAADVAQTAHGHQFLGEEGRRGGAHDTAQVVGRRGTGVAHVGGEQFRQQRAHGRKCHAHQKQFDAQEQRHTPGRALGQQRFHEEAGQDRQHATNDQHRLAPVTVAGPGRQRGGGRHEQHREAQQAEEGFAAVAERCNTVAQGKHRGDVKQRVAHHHRAGAQQDGRPVLAEQLEQRDLHPFLARHGVGEYRGLMQLESHVQADHHQRGAEQERNAPAP